MLLDPCSAAPVHGLADSSEGMLSTFKTVHVSGDGDAGYIVWFPAYATHDSKVPLTDRYTGSAFEWRSTDSTRQPVNTNAHPYGSAVIGGSHTASSPAVGASNFVESNTCADFRTIAACIQATYIGTTLDQKGIIAPITNLSLDVLLSGGVSNGPASVDQLLVLADKPIRPGQDHEVRYRPDQRELESFKTELSTPILIADPDVGEISVLTTEAYNFGPKCIGFVWKGIPNASLDLRCHQVIEWRPEIGSNFAQITPTTPNTPPAKTYLARLDALLPGWQTLSRRAAQTALRRLISNYTRRSQHLLY